MNSLGSIIALALLLFGGISFFTKSVLIKHLSFVVCPIISLIIFVLQMFQEETALHIKWFHIHNISFDLSLTFNLIGMFLCSVIIAILLCIQLAYTKLEAEKTPHNTHNIQVYLNVFVAIMCFAILLNNLLSFYFGIEFLGIISAILVGYNNNHDGQTTTTFIFNKLASLLFLIAIVLIVQTTQSFDFNSIKIFFDDIDTNTKLIFPATLLFISCLCKSAQFPFSHWLLNTTSANTYVSILLHSATVVGIGGIFIAKCYFIFEVIPHVKQLMILAGITTAILMGISSLFQINIKKIIACSTAASMGFVFIACGIGEYSVSILYFICHAFFKSVFFLSMAYVMHASINETNILKMGGISKLIPNINDIIWISFASTIGLPFFVSFFGKVSLLSALLNAGQNHIAAWTIFANIMLTIAFYRLIYLSMYGKSRMDDSVLARVRDISGGALAPPWILIAISVFGSFIAWSMYEWNILHFGLGGFVYSRTFSDYISENVLEIFQIVIAIFFALLIKMQYKKIKNISFVSKSIPLLKNIMLTEKLATYLYNIFNMIIKPIHRFDQKMNELINEICHRISYSGSENINKMYKIEILGQLYWIYIGFILSILFTLWLSYA